MRSSRRSVRVPRHTVAFIITDDDRIFEAVSQGCLRVEPIRMYEAYLRNFEIDRDAGRAVKFTLKDYQHERSYRSSTTSRERVACTTIRRNRKSRRSLADCDDRRWQDGDGGRRDRGALLRRNETSTSTADPGAVVIWFSDDPNLNDQTRIRLMQASDKLTYDRLVTIKPPFSVPAHAPYGVLLEHAASVAHIAADARR